jgi:hypothetical protein
LVRGIPKEGLDEVGRYGCPVSVEVKAVDEDMEAIVGRDLVEALAEHHAGAHRAALGEADAILVVQ